MNEMNAPNPSGYKMKTPTKATAGATRAYPVRAWRRLCGRDRRGGEGGTWGPTRRGRARRCRTGCHSSPPTLQARLVQRTYQRPARQASTAPRTEVSRGPRRRSACTGSRSRPVERGLDAALTDLESFVDVVAVDGLIEHLEPRGTRIVEHGIVGQRVLNGAVLERVEGNGVIGVFLRRTTK